MADRYSFSLTTFSPSGKLVQIEYALNAVNQGVTAIGIKATNGVVLATEKKASTPLNDPNSTIKIERITPDIGATYAGMGPDFRKLITNAQKASHKDYKLIYNEYPPVEMCVEMAAQEMQKATQQGGTRPYGVSLLIAGWDEKGGKRGKKGPSLYQVDPSGTYFGWKATAIGKNATSAKTFLEKRYSPDLELEDAIHIALLTLKETIEGEMNGDTIELGIVGPPSPDLLGYEGVEGAIGPRFRKLTKQEVEDYLTSL